MLYIYYLQIAQSKSEWIEYILIDICQHIYVLSIVKDVLWDSGHYFDLVFISHE